eukprot:CAMPEP_0172206648 /NCGR_PEP_ID=MMETSP1050-20130122/33343_1 /TAXON_ID=233186 /ORGANISM="Cryptomonas curvata, Strain CCAP979/52" /LENGTH=143 /DNA_ID=CAMNT_0012885771 /DNA_START=168 /DNA_END=599 /DNA_ORIENTATION=+
MERVAPLNGPTGTNSRRFGLISLSLLVICMGIIALAIQNGNPTAEEKVAGRALGALAMQEEAHELRVLERVGNEHTDNTKRVTRSPPPLVIRPRIVKTNLAEIPPKHVKRQAVSSPVSDGWKNLGAVAESNIFSSKPKSRRQN